MVTLSLGVLDVPYTEQGASHQRRVKFKKGFRPKVYKVVGSTGDVAEILEAKYDVISVFFDVYSYLIVGKMEEIIKGQIENLFLGVPPQPDPFAEVSSFIKDCFHNFLSNREIETLGISGVPTEAALRGVNHRFKRPYQRRSPRPSFIDTGMYEASFTAEFKS